MADLTCLIFGKIWTASSFVLAPRRCDSRTAVATTAKKIRIRYIHCLTSKYLWRGYRTPTLVWSFVRSFSNVPKKLLGFASKGSSSLVAPDDQAWLFFLKVLCPIVFISALINASIRAVIIAPVVPALQSAPGKLQSFNAVSS